jgi:hypothetical protein
MGFLSSLFGSSKSKPAVQQVVQSQKLPAEIAPAVKRVIDEAEAIYDAEKERGYVPYEGATIAPFTPQEEQAMQGIAGLVGTQQPFIDESLGITRAQTEQFTPEVAQQFMSPYQRAVTDIEKREAQRVFEREVMPRLEAQAVQAGGMSGLGTRAALEAAEAQRTQAQLLSDIEARGLQAAFQDARAAFEQQKAREAGAAAAIGRAGAETFKAGLAEQGALQAVGEQRRDLAQSALDEEYFKFLEEREFPQQRLAEYSGFVYGNPLTRLPTSTTQTTGTQFQPSFGRQLLGIGATLGGSFLGGPGGAAAFNKFFAKTGGGLSDIIKRKEGGGFPDLSGDGKVTQKDILMGRGVIPRSLGGGLGLQGILDQNKLTLPEFRALGLQTPEEIEQTQKERAAKRLELAQQGTSVPFARGAISDLLLAIGDAAMKGPEFNVAGSFAERTKERTKRQKEADKLSTQQKIANLEAEFKAEDQVRGLPSKVKEKLAALEDRRIKRQTKLAELEKIRKEIKGGSPRTAMYKPLTDEEEDTQRKLLESRIPVIRLGSEEETAAFRDTMARLRSSAKDLIVQQARQEMANDKNLNNFDDAVIRAIKTLGPKFIKDNIKDKGKLGTGFSRNVYDPIADAISSIVD